MSKQYRNVAIGKEYKVKKSRVTKTKYCSRQCLYESQKKVMPNEP